MNNSEIPGAGSQSEKEPTIQNLAQRKMEGIEGGVEKIRELSRLLRESTGMADKLAAELDEKVNGDLQKLENSVNAGALNEVEEIFKVYDGLAGNICKIIGAELHNANEFQRFMAQMKIALNKE